MSLTRYDFNGSAECLGGGGADGGFEIGLGGGGFSVVGSCGSLVLHDLSLIFI